MALVWATGKRVTQRVNPSVSSELSVRSHRELLANMGAADKYGGGSESLFDAQLLTPRIGYATGRAESRPGSSPAMMIQPPAPLQLRPLSRSDYQKGFLQLLAQLTSVGDVSEETFLKRFATMQGCPGTYFVIVLEDTSTSQIVGAATLVVEQKFIHHCGTRGRLEDVVVSDKYRGKQLGKLLTNRVSLMAQQVGCYKLTLECKDKLIPFYASLGFTAEKGNSNFMTARFDDVS